MGYSSGRSILDFYVDSSKNAEEYVKRNKVRKTYRLIINILYLTVVVILLGGLLLFIWWLGSR